MSFNSKTYWEERYQRNLTSGCGSYGRLSEYKASVINEFIDEFAIESVVEFGCGDGNQLKQIKCKKYVGYDVSQCVINKCKALFAFDTGKTFDLYENYGGTQYDLSLSLDVIYHLVEDNVFNEYMIKLFNAASKYVIIYSSNGDIFTEHATHILDRHFTNWIITNRKDFMLYKHIKNKYPYTPANPDQTSVSDFFIYKKTTSNV